MNTFVLLALVDSTGIYRQPFAVLLPLCAGHVADLEFRLLSPLAGARHAVLPAYVRHAEPLVALFARCLALLNTHSVSRKHVLPFLAAHEHLQLELSVGDKLSAMTLRETLRCSSRGTASASPGRPTNTAMSSSRLPAPTTPTVAHCWSTLLGWLLGARMSWLRSRWL